MMRSVLAAILLFSAGEMVSMAAEPMGHSHEAMSGHTSGGGAVQAATSSRAQQTCPVTGKAVNPAVFVEQDGHKVYFCCEGCVAKFKKEPTRYLAAVYRQVYPQRVQVTCPVMGETIDGKTSVSVNGEPVGFCCKTCPPKFKAAPGEYAAKLEAAYTDQVHCPVTGKAIDPQFSSDYKGHTVYFHSAHALKQFEVDPAKYARNLLPEAGVLARGATADDDMVLVATDSPDEQVLQRRTATPEVYKGKVYFLPSGDAVKQFQANAESIAARIAAKAHDRSGAGHWFTCSMHPDVLQMGPGKCPKCAMALAPVAGPERQPAPGRHPMTKMAGHAEMHVGNHEMKGRHGDDHADHQ